MARSTNKKHYLARAVFVTNCQGKLREENIGNEDNGRRRKTGSEEEIEMRKWFSQRLNPEHASVEPWLSLGVDCRSVDAADGMLTQCNRQRCASKQTRCGGR